MNCCSYVERPNSESLSCRMTNFLCCGIGVAFSSFKSLKTKNTGIHDLSLPINPKKLKKNWKFEFFLYLAFVLAFKQFLAFFQFFWPFYTPCSYNYLKLSQFCCLNTWKGCYYFLSEKNHCDIVKTMYQKFVKLFIVYAMVSVG